APPVHAFSWPMPAPGAPPTTPLPLILSATQILAAMPWVLIAPPYGFPPSPSGQARLRISSEPVWFRPASLRVVALSEAGELHWPVYRTTLHMAHKPADMALLAFALQAVTWCYKARETRVLFPHSISE